MKFSLLGLKLQAVRGGDGIYWWFCSGFFYNNPLFFLPVWRDFRASLVIQWRGLSVLQELETIFSMEVCIIEESVRQSLACVAVYW